MRAAAPLTFRSRATSIAADSRFPMIKFADPTSLLGQWRELVMPRSVLPQRQKTDGIPAVRHVAGQGGLQTESPPRRLSHVRYLRGAGPKAPEQSRSDGASFALPLRTIGAA